MGQEYKLLQDIVEEHSSRILNLKKYFPFFKLQEASLNMFKEGKYAFVDMGYITMAVLRFFIEENNFKDREVTYQEYYNFVTEILSRDFEMKLSEEENKEVVDYIFDKLKNDGKPFYMDYFDPADKKKKTARMKLINSHILNNQIMYYITADAIEFYLDTKEMKDESKISVQQLLLEKMISSQNFKGGIDVVKRINNEVSRIRLRKNEVLSVLSGDIFEGVKILETFSNDVMRWFEEEQTLFVKNKDLIDKALERAETDAGDVEDKEKYYGVLGEIYALETELKKAITRHNELLSECTELQIKADEIISRAKIARLRKSFDFKLFMERTEKIDNADLIKHIVIPLLGMNVRKTFSPGNIDDLVTYKADKDERAEKALQGNEEIYVYDDEIEEKRITDNFKAILKTLLDTVLSRAEFDLRDFNRILELKYFDVIFKNSDYYSFLVHLCQKKEYDIDKIRKEQDTFLDRIITELLETNENRYRGLKFSIDMSGEMNKDIISNHQIISAEMEQDYITSNILFKRES